MKADPFFELLEALRGEGLSVQADIDVPSEPNGEWWADISVEGWRTTVSWRASSKFGVYTSDDGFGFKPDEVYADAQKAALRLLQLRRRTERDREGAAALTLKDVRQLTAVSQEVVAERLKKGQAEVSRLEAREDAKLSTIEDFVRALGGTLEISVRFDDFSGPLVLRSPRASGGRARNAA